MNRLLIIGTLLSLCAVTGKTFEQTNTAKTLNKEKMKPACVTIERVIGKNQLMQASLPLKNKLL